MEMKYKEGDKVIIKPFGDKGVVVRVIDNLLWGNRYIVKITESKFSSSFPIVGSEEDFYEKNLTLDV